jgi:type II secretory pathway pseudopilin PulG
MASKAPLSTYAETPEDERVVQEYKDQQKMLMDSLVNRKQLFDPTLLAMAQGFLSPTKSGSFGESLGNVAAAVAPVQQAEEQRAREIAKMRFDMAQQNLQTHQATTADKAFNEMVTRIRPPVAPPASGAPASALPADPSAAAPSQGAQGRPITAADIALLANKPGGAAKAKILQDMITLDRGRIRTNENFIIDVDAPGGPKVIADLRAGKQEPSEIVVDGKTLTINMTPTELRDFNRAYAQNKGDEFYKKT